LGLLPTPSQTIGPFFAPLLENFGSELVAPGHPGAVRITGRLLDGATVEDVAAVTTAPFVVALEESHVR